MVQTSCNESPITTLSPQASHALRNQHKEGKKIPHDVRLSQESLPQQKFQKKELNFPPRRALTS